MIRVEEFLQMSDWEDFLEFVRETYRPDHPLCSREFFEWQVKLKENDAKATVICAWDNDRLVGIMGYVPLAAHWGTPGQEVQSAWFTHWMVRKDAPRGVGVLLIKKAQEMFPLVLTLNASEQGLPLLMSLGWSCVHHIPRYLCVLDKDQSIPMLPPKALEGELEKFIFKPKDFPSAVTRDLISKQENYNPRWELYPQLNFSVIRSLDYLTHRYTEHPFFKYRIILAGKQHRPAVCVYRIEQAFGSFEALVGRIVDFFYPADEEGHRDGISLLQQVLFQLKNTGCAYADFICSNKTFGQTWRELGAEEEPFDRLILPMRLSPIQQIKKEQSFSFLVGEHCAPILENLYISKSDVDGDNPASLNPTTASISRC
ncbi:MAG TPA: hypothetical protein VI749_07125 [Candidatus Omnitrophota bacterium]|nr:hypothetical protein [Candidatus Omnitrophota bacterium]